MKQLILGLVSLTVALPLASTVWAAPIVFDEATDTTTGDYSELGGPNDVGQFDLAAGVNQFFGSIRTPDDGSDTFNILIGSGQLLDDVAVGFGLNVTPFNPIAVSQNTRLRIFRTSGTTDLLALEIPIAQSADLYSAPSSFELDPGLYNVLMSSELLALNSGAAPRYRMDFTVTPEPSSMMLLLSGGLIALLAYVRYRRRR